MQCYITDRRTLQANTGLLDNIERNLAAGVEWIQIREKDLSARELFD
jgi:thiamine monophosphate synthase